MHKKKLAQRRREYYKKRLNPHKGRSPAEYERATYACKQIAERIGDMLQGTIDHNGKFKVFPGWLPWEGLITEDVAANQEFDRKRWTLMMQEGVEEDMHLTQMVNKQLKATNLIRAAATFTNSEDLHFIFQGMVPSPLPCDTWGRYPLTRYQWGIIQAPLTLSHIMWQWLPAIRNFTDDDTFEFDTYHGWFMDTGKILRPGSTYGYDGTDWSGHQWPGRTFYLDITNRFSNKLTAKATACQS